MSPSVVRGELGAGAASPVRVPDDGAPAADAGVRDEDVGTDAASVVGDPSDGVALTGPDWTVPVEPVAVFPPPTCAAPIVSVAEFAPPSPPIVTGADAFVPPAPAVVPP